MNPMNRKLTETERNAISTALRVAAEVYENDRAVVNQNPRIALRFQRQGIDARVLADTVDAADSLSVEWTPEGIAS